MRTKGRQTRHFRATYNKFTEGAEISGLKCIHRAKGFHMRTDSKVSLLGISMAVLGCSCVFQLRLEGAVLVRVQEAVFCGNDDFEGDA